MKTKIQGIYKIRNCINGKVYIGQSIDIEYRWKCHKRCMTLNITHPLYRSIRKYGIDNFEFIILEEVIPVQKLDEREQYWMDHYQCYNPEFGYNLSLTSGGSTRGFKASDETKLKLSESHKGQAAWNKGKIGWNKGKKCSDETKLKMSLAHKSRKRKPLSEEHKRKIKLNNKNAFKGKHHTLESRLKMMETKRLKKLQLVRNRLSSEDIQKFEQNNIIQFIRKCI